MNEEEKQLLWTICFSRLCMSFTYGTLTYSETKDPYALVHAQPAIQSLKILRGYDREYLDSLL